MILWAKERGRRDTTEVAMLCYQPSLLRKRREMGEGHVCVCGGGGGGGGGKRERKTSKRGREPTLSTTNCFYRSAGLIDLIRHSMIESICVRRKEMEQTVAEGWGWGVESGGGGGSRGDGWLKMNRTDVLVFCPSFLPLEECGTTCSDSRPVRPYKQSRQPFLCKPVWFLDGSSCTGQQTPLDSRHGLDGSSCTGQQPPSRFSPWVGLV